MIVSASRRTDVPALYAPWLAGRLREGFADVPHPYDPGRVRRVDLRPAPAGGLGALVLWTRDPSPLLGEVAGWERSGVRTLWLVTVTGYPRALEPRAPDPDVAVEAVGRLADAVGPARVFWRYDPLLACPGLGVDARWHRDNFRRLADRLAGRVSRCVVSLYDDYRKARLRLARGGAPAGADPGLAEVLVPAASERGIELRSCCEDLAPAGIGAGACVDGAHLDRLWDLGIGDRRDPGQRPGCRCAPSVDIGVYDTCVHGCLYCYATGSDTRVRARRRAHRPGAPRLA